MIALLFMKGHSERVPGKNMRPLGFRPLFTWMMDTLLDCRGIDEIVLDTDSDAIKIAVEAYYADSVKILDRPIELRGDNVTANSLIAGMLDRVDGEHFIQVHVTSPFLKAETIGKAIRQYHAEINEHDSLFGVTKYNKPFYIEYGIPINHNPHVIKPTQDIKPIFEDNSSMYLFSRASFNVRGSRHGKMPQPFEISRTEAVDIDTEEDWEAASLIAKSMLRP